uniref:Brain-specific angiogenesis inhibitor 1-associated protein 2 n=1 Tax=Daphnia galeata TaxID=27404 RepID=A0A8J2RMY5_9CRUS|nr:unnamed protein product [Daphnia galeata]
MEPEEMAKNVDACYKNILDKFNPGARQLINAGKSYLKSLHGAAAAAKIYLESLSRVAKQAQQGTCGGTADIGIAMQQMVDVQREIQSQQLNTLKAFYVDLIVPLESNIEKDTKVVQADHKKFNQQYRSQYEVYSKAMSLVKKHSKKSSSKVNRSSASYDKEIKHLQTMDEEKAKLDAFCEQSLKEAIAQERKRYGFVLERQTSLSKHFLAHYGKGAALLEKHLDGWQETSKAREELPPCVEFLLGQQNGANSENLYALPRTPVLTLEDEVDFCSASQMRKSHSIDTSYLYEEAQSTFTEAVNPKISANQGLGAAIGGDNRHMGGGTNLCKSKSEFNLAFASPNRSVRSGFGTTARPKSLALPGSTKGTVRALYAYLSSGEHQINFLEGDLILLLGDEPVSFHSNANGDRNKGWYYGENVRTGKRGWFPLAYTEQVKDADVDSGLGLRSQFDSNLVSAGPVVLAANNVDAESTTSGNSSASNSSASGGGHITQITSSSASAALKSSSARNSQVIVGKQQQQNNNATNSRPNSLLLGGDRTLSNKFPGFSKLRKSRSAFAERLLFPATTPSAPNCPATTPSAAPVPSAEHDGRSTAGATPASPSPMINNSTMMTMLPLSHSSSTPRMFSSCTPMNNNGNSSSTSAVLITNNSSSSPSHSNHITSAAVFSPTKKAPAPPPRLQTTIGPQSVQHHSSLLLGMSNAADLSLRSSSDSGFATEPASAPVHEQQHQQQQQNQPPSTRLEQPLPPPAPEIDYSDEESLKFPPNLSRQWLLYSSALDVSQNSLSMCSASSAMEWRQQPKSCSGNSVGSDEKLEKTTGVGRSNYHNQGLSMTLDRPTKTRPMSGISMAAVTADRGGKQQLNSKQQQHLSAASSSSSTSSISSISTSASTSLPSVIRTNNKLSSYPPVLGYLATLTRSKASKQLRRHLNMSSEINSGKLEKENQQGVTNNVDQQQMSERSAAVRRLSGLFTKNSSLSSSSNGSAGQRDPGTTTGPTSGGGSMATAAKIKNKLSAAPGILKTALFRTRSKDSFLDTSSFFQEVHQQSLPSLAAEATPWQHKSSVPCYVGWRPPMPLPKSCQATDVDSRPPSAMNSNTVRRRVTRTESRRSNLGWRKYGSESDLLDPAGSSESGYMAIDPFLPPILPSWPPTLALLHPFYPGRLGGGCTDEPYSRATNYAESSGSIMPHTLPRKFQPDSWLHSSSPSLRVQFNLDELDEASQEEPSKKTTAAGEEQRQIKAEFEEYSLRLKQRLQMAKSGSSHSLDHLSDAASDGQACEPWYDLWAPEISVRLCEIAQL